MVIWLTGLSGAGKTTIGKELQISLKRRNNVVLIDGDDVRSIVGDDIGYDVESRKINAWRICRLCNYLDSQGLDVICCTISMFEEIRTWNRANYKKYFEIFIDVPMHELINRDQKKIYSKALAGEISNVVGIDIPLTFPEKPDMVISNIPPYRSPDDIVKDILVEIQKECFEEFLR